MINEDNEPDYLAIMEREFRKTLDAIDQFEEEHEANAPEWVLHEYLEQFATKVLEDFTGDHIDIDNHLSIRHTYLPVGDEGDMEFKVYFKALDNLGETFTQVWCHSKAERV